MDHYYLISGKVDVHHHLSRHFDIFMNGERQYRVVEAQSGPDGYVVRHKLNENGKIQTIGDDVVTETVPGNVEIRRVVSGLEYKHPVPKPFVPHIMPKESYYGTQEV